MSPIDAEFRTPAEALDVVQQAKAAVAERLAVHWGWDAAFALAIGAVYAVHALPPPLGALTMVPFVMLVAWLVVVRRSRSGLWIQGPGPRSARRFSIALNLLLGAMLLLVLTSSLLLGLRWPALAAGAIAAAGTFVLSRLWGRAYRRALTGEAG